MGKEKLVETIRKLLVTDQDFDFLMKLTETELETLVASIRGWLDGDTYARESN